MEVARLLVEKGADVNAAMADGTTALMLAWRHGHERVACRLMEKGAQLPSASIQ